MTTKKDFTSQENIDHEQDHGKEGNLSNGNDQPVNTSKKTYVKNANAAGDGAFGHTETGVPDDEDVVEKKEAEPPY